MFLSKPPPLSVLAEAAVFDPYGNKTKNPGVAKVVSRSIGEQDAGRSSCPTRSKKVAASSVWASVNTFHAASEDSAKVAEIFLPLIPTTPQKAKLTEICENFFIFFSLPTSPKNENCQK